MIDQIPEGFKIEDHLCFGMRKSHPGLLEIKIHNPVKKNAISGVPEKRLTQLILDAQADENVKVILLHGGNFFSSGNDLSMFAMKMKPAEAIEYAETGVKIIMVNMLMAMAKTVKPIVTLVRGAAIGIGFTLTAHSTFIYCSPEAKFMTPFMKSCQSPEGTSTLLFAQQFGVRLANEILLTDKWVTAK